MPAYAMIPAAPVLLADIDGLETERTAALRTRIHNVLTTQTEWALPVVALPPVAGLGGWGIDRGLDTRTGELLKGDDWVETVNALSAEDRRTSETTDPAIIVALLHAQAAGVEVGPMGSGEHLLMPIDLSGAASENAPLAPVDGADEFDDRVVTVLADSDPIDHTEMLTLTAEADHFHANLSALKAGVHHLDRRGRRLGGLDVVFDEHVHDVRSLCGMGTC